MDIASALVALRMGMKVSREAWGDKTWIELEQDVFYMRAPHVWHTACYLTTADILANDWLIVDRQ